MQEAMVVEWDQNLVEQIDTEGKRWYQYAGTRVYCKHCGVRLRNPHAGRLLLTGIVIFEIINPLIVQPLAREYGIIIFLPESWC